MQPKGSNSKHDRLLIGPREGMSDRSSASEAQTRTILFTKTIRYPVTSCDAELTRQKALRWRDPQGSIELSSRFDPAILIV
jgi:hypothetical protein